MDTYQAFSETVSIRPASPDLTQSAARGDRGGGWALLPAPRVRLARDANRRRGRSGRRTNPWGLHSDTATGEKPVLRNQPIHRAQGRGGHAGSGDRSHAW